jgi:two-component system, NtrC family, sensor kinase
MPPITHRCKGRPDVKLRTKFIILIGLVVTISYGITFYRTSAFQHELVIAQAVNQARMLHHQILLTRKWISDHNGVFLIKGPGVEANPFLSEPQIVDAAGRMLVKRNPAMVTRELSEYADRAGFCRYRITSLHPLNPANSPDDFEQRGLALFQQGVPELIQITGSEGGNWLRYMAPLVVEESCLECHGTQGYRIGDIRGGLSVSIPMNWAYESIASNNRLLLAIGVLTICVVGVTIFLLIDMLVVRRLGLLARAMDGFSGEEEKPGRLPAGKDEIGSLAGKFRELCTRLITSRQELDRTREQVFQGEKLASLGRLAAGIAHEINNPLGGMLNCVKSMQETPDDADKNRRYLDLLGKGLQRIGHTVRQLLNFGRREPLQLREVEVDGLVRDCFDLLTYSLKEIELELDPGLARPYPVDVEALKQVVVNIGLNAIQAMPGGGVLHVRTREEGNRLLLSFRDTGEGIAPENLARIFDPFFTTKEIGEGTGLGLSVTHSLVQRMQGTIRVESLPGQGAIFIVEIPVPG